MDKIYYTPLHEWIEINGNVAILGLTEKALPGDIVYIELPKVGLEVEKGAPCAVVESAKTAMDVHAPLSGVVSAINESVYDDPDTVTKNRAWLIQITFEGEADTTGWLDEEE